MKASEQGESRLICRFIVERFEEKESPSSQLEVKGRRNPRL